MAFMNPRRVTTITKTNLVGAQTVSFKTVLFMALVQASSQLIFSRFEIKSCSDYLAKMGTVGEIF